MVDAFSEIHDHNLYSLKGERMPGKKGNTMTREKSRKAKKTALPRNSIPKGNSQAAKPQGDKQWDVNRNPQNSGTKQNWQDRQPMNNPSDPNRRAGEELMEDEDTEVGL
jgi:hypothetical protein